MKTLVTIIFILFIGIAAQAQDTPTEVKVKKVEMSVVTETASTAKENTVARVYKFKNSRIKKELSFKTKRNKAKLA